MKITLNAGHTLSGKGTGASSKYASETQKNREVLKRLTEMLKEKGHTVYNATVDKSNNDLADICAIERRNKSDVFLSIHLNAIRLQTAEIGVETYYKTSSGKKYAEKIQSELVKEVGWKNRGIKTANFHVLSNTSAPAVLAELGFCDSKGDMDKWNTEKICRALFKGLTGSSYTSNAKPPVTPPVKPPTNNKQLWELCISGELIRELQVAIKVKVDGYFGEDTLKKCPLSKYNHRGTPVKVIQKRLVQLGYNTNGVDGIFGNGTKNAVVAFQKKKGLSADGIVGQATWKALMLK